MHRLKYIKDKLLECVECQMECLSTADTVELGEVIDMIKDLEEAMYYCVKTKKILEEEEHHESMETLSIKTK